MAQIIQSGANGFKETSSLAVLVSYTTAQLAVGLHLIYLEGGIWMFLSGVASFLVYFWFALLSFFFPRCL